MKNIKQVTDNILIIYTLTAFFSLIVGIILDSDFLLTIGAIVAVMGALFVNNYRTKHIIGILKQNNLWNDETFEKKKLPKDLKQKIEIAEEIFKQEEKLDGFS